MGLFDLFKKKEEKTGYQGIIIPPAPKPKPVAPAAPASEEKKAEAVTPEVPVSEVVKEPTTKPAPAAAAAATTIEANSTADAMSLEELLQRAGSQPEYRAEFYKRLLTDELIIITQDNGRPTGRQTLTEDMEVKIASFPDGVLPVFSSKERIFDKGIVKEEVHYLALPGQQLFEFTKGATFALNPYSDFGKKLEVAEIEALLSGEIFNDEGLMLNVEKETQVMIGQPTVYPKAIVDALKPLLASIEGVEAAYLAWIQHPDLQKPNYIFAIDAEGNFRDISASIAAEVKKHLPADDIIDIIKIEHGPSISSYFLEQTQPFYTR